MSRFLRIAVLAPLLIIIAACSGQPSPGNTTPVQLAQAKIWVAGVAGALAATSVVYVGPNADQVHQAAAGLQSAAAQFQQITEVPTARSAALTVVSLAQQLVPLVAPVLGDRAFYVSGGLAIVQAFIAALPAPPAAPIQTAAVLAAGHSMTD